jgi:uncharacterized protein (TIGR03083 family)
VEFAPRYESPAVIDIDSVIADPTPAVVRQRDRLTSALSELSSEDWAVPSRCEGWSVQDVAEHLASVNQFWLHSLRSGLRGEPSRLLLTFDPVTVPAQMVERARGAAPAATLERLAASNAELAGLLVSMSDGDWTKVAEAPPGPWANASRSNLMRYRPRWHTFALSLRPSTSMPARHVQVHSP